MKKYTPELKPAFSLMEMMIVLLIVAIVAAASAPMVTRKMARNAGSGDSPFVFTGTQNQIAFPQNGNVLLGRTRLLQDSSNNDVPAGLTINSDANIPQIAFGQGNEYRGRLEMTENSVALTNKDVGKDAVAIGIGASAEGSNNNEYGGIAIGEGAKANADQVVIGELIKITRTGDIQIGGLLFKRVENNYTIDATINGQKSPISLKVTPIPPPGAQAGRPTQPEQFGGGSAGFGGGAVEKISEKAEMIERAAK